MPAFMNAADVLMFSLKDELCFNLTVPAKVQFYMSQGKPILAMINGDGAALVKEADCGMSVKAGDYSTLADAIQQMSTLPKEKLLIFGQKGKNFYEEHFRKELRINQLEKLLNEDYK